MASYSSLSWRWLLLAALLYAGLFAWCAWPLPLAWGSASVGRPDANANQYFWNAWNLQRQLALGHSPMQTPLLLHPAGSSRWMHTYTPVLGALSVPLRQPYQALNLGLLLSFGLSGVGAAWLAGCRVQQPLLCLLVGFAFAFTPLKLAHWPAHYQLLLTAGVPCFVGTYLAAFSFAAGRWPRLRNPWALAAALLLAQRQPDSLALVPGPTPAELAQFQRRYGRPVFVVEPAYYHQPAHQLLRRWLLPLGYREQVVPDSAGPYALLAPP